jgi:hypothetical protein
MCASDFDAAEVFSQTRVRRGRVARKCYECDLPIPIGAPYIRTFMVYEGDADTYSVHVECDAIADFVRDHICRVEHDELQARRKPQHRERFDGMILMGGLGEEIWQLTEYWWQLTADDAAEVRALGFDVDDDGDGDVTASPAQVAEWIWDIVRDSYRPAVAA